MARAGPRFLADRRAFWVRADTKHIAGTRTRSNPGVDLVHGKVTYFVGRPNIKSTPWPGMARWREHLYVVLSRLATRTPEFFRIPSDQVIELRAEVEI